jgi:hypothetical protein
MAAVVSGVDVVQPTQGPLLTQSSARHRNDLFLLGFGLLLHGTRRRGRYISITERTFHPTLHRGNKGKAGWRGRRGIDGGLWVGITVDRLNVVAEIAVECKGEIFGDMLEVLRTGR